MGLDDIKKHIQDKAEEEIAKINAAATKEAAELKSKWEEKIKLERERLMSELNRRAESKLAQAKFKIREKIKAEELKAKQAQIDRVYDLALKEVDKMPENDYITMLESLLGPIKDEEGELHTCAKRVNDLKKAAKALGCKAKVSDEDLDITGGFIFTSEKIDVDATFETLMNKVRGNSLIKVHNILFNE